MKNAQDAQKEVIIEDTEMNNPLATTSCEQETCNEGIVVTLRLLHCTTLYDNVYLL